MSQRKQADLWKKLVAEAGEAEIDRAASVSVAQAEAELAAAGFDVAAERAKANAFLDALEKGEPLSTAPAPVPAPTPAPVPTPHSASPPRRPRPAFAWLAAAASFGAVAGGALHAALESPAFVTAPRPQGGPTTAADLVVAADARRKAAAACDANRWSVCLAELDHARAVDPGGDDEPSVQRLREKAVASILEKPEPPPR